MRGSRMNETPDSSSNVARENWAPARAVRSASLADLQKAPGVSAAVAQQVYDFYHAR